VKEEVKLLHMLSVTRYSKFVWSILRSRAAATWGQRDPMTEEKDHGQKFEGHDIPGYGNHLPNCQGTNFDLKKKKAA
jgi:hypothetical protein